MNKLNSTGPNINTWGTPLAVCLQQDFVPLVKSRWAQPFIQFSVTPLCTHVTCSSSACLREMIWETVKSLSKVKLNNIHYSHSPSLSPHCRRLIDWSSMVSSLQFYADSPDHLVLLVFEMLFRRIISITFPGTEADQSVILWFFHLALLEDRIDIYSLPEPLPVPVTVQRQSRVTPQYHQPAPSALLWVKLLRACEHIYVHTVCLSASSLVLLHQM